MAGSSGFCYHYGAEEYASLTDYCCYCLVSIADYHRRLHEFEFNIVGPGYSRRDITPEVLARAERGRPSAGPDATRLAKLSESLARPAVA